MVRADIRSAADLKGKRLGVSRFGTASDFGTRLMVSKLGLNPDSDVTILQIGDTPTRVAALMAKSVDGAIFDPPDHKRAVENGGRWLAASDMFFSHPGNLLMPGRGARMDDGWETKRRRGPGHDWVVLRLGIEGTVRRVEIDTAHFKGNYPDRCSIQAADITGGTDQSLITQSMFWRTLLPEQKLEMDRPHAFQKEVAELGAITHVRLNIIPDGGVSRMRLWGELI